MVLSNFSGSLKPSRSASILDTSGRESCQPRRKGAGAPAPALPAGRGPALQREKIPLISNCHTHPPHPACGKPSLASLVLSGHSSTKEASVTNEGVGGGRGLGGLSPTVQPTTNICLSPEPPGETGQGRMRPTPSPGQDTRGPSGAADGILEALRVCFSSEKRNLGLGTHWAVVLNRAPSGSGRKEWAPGRVLLRCLPGPRASWSFPGTLGDWQRRGGPEKRGCQAGCGQRREGMACWDRPGLALRSAAATPVFPDPTGQILAQGPDGSMRFLWQLGKEGLLC